jgi:hypothetical protein
MRSELQGGETAIGPAAGLASGRGIALLRAMNVSTYA